MDAGAVEAAVVTEDADSIGQRGMSPGSGKGGGYRAPAAPTTRRLRPGGTLGWEKYDKWTNMGSHPTLVEDAVQKITTAMTA